MTIARVARAARLLAAGRLDFTFDRLVFPRGNLGARQAANFLLSRLEARQRVLRPWSYPIALQLEPTVRCQLSCPLCPRERVNGSLGDGLMPFEAYARLLAEVGPRLLAIAFWQWGEPLLHPQLPEMVALAKRHGILTLLATNGQTDPDEARLGELCDAGLDLLIVALDGVTEEVYRGFRQGGSAAATRRFLAEAVRRRDARPGADRPLLNARIIATRASEPEIGAARDFARDAGVDLFSIKSVSLYDSDDPDHAALPAARDLRSFQYQGGREAAGYAALPNHCLKPWSWPTLRHDGELLLCECDHALAHPLGNVFESVSFRAVWRGGRARELRRAFPENGKVELEFCRRCRYKLDDAIRETVALKPVAGVRPLRALAGTGPR
jgi:MoaA/NifB/PqqE/SkfB family radical SAM enzyme